MLNFGITGLYIKKNSYISVYSWIYQYKTPSVKYRTILEKLIYIEKYIYIYLNLYIKPQLGIYTQIKKNGIK